MASADHDGFVKYWQPNMNNVHMFQAHKDEPIRSLWYMTLLHFIIQILNLLFFFKLFLKQIFLCFKKFKYE